MARPTSRFVCQSCAAISPKWAGRCENCSEWNSIVEEAITRPGPTGKAPTGKAATGRRVEFVGMAGSADPPPRCPTGIAELDRVLGGGLVQASAVLVGGDPGIGKSTLMLQAAASLARQGRRVFYVSGEESIEQLRLRARRLGVLDAPLELAAAINLRDIAASLEAAGSELGMRKRLAAVRLALGYGGRRRNVILVHRDVETFLAKFFFDIDGAGQLQGKQPGAHPVELGSTHAVLDDVNGGAGEMGAYHLAFCSSGVAVYPH